ncbi:MAG: peroxide stress protein YaaA [Flavobacteriaceae bacterium]|nr:peroxide stress protein YaaA [Flavobacteriaceae bacterium]
MKIIISPAKSLDFKTELPTKNFSTPNFLSESKKINELLKKKSPSELKSLMSISEKLAELNWNRNNTFKTPFNIENARPSIFTFNGDVYSGLDAFSLSMDQLNQAQKSLRILSGLYGLLKPLDLIQPYRLEMGTKLNVEGSLNLYGFWRNKITNKLNDELNENEFFVNLASNEYSSAIDRKLLKTTMISPSFKDMKNGKLKIISFYAKKARGMMVRYILDNEINNLEDLRGFDYGGYSYSSEESEKMKELVFIR